MATYAIGDVQGCFTALTSLIKSIGYRADSDQLWFVGDLVNRGPQSLETLRFVRSLGDRAVTVLGNHDLHLLCVAEGFAARRPDDTLDDILRAPDRDDLLQWLRQQPLIHNSGDFTMVHAGLLAQWRTADALRVGSEVQRALSGRDYRTLLRSMYGDEPRAWSDDLAGEARLRVVVNAMTRMRMCNTRGEMSLKFKGPPEKAPKDLLPWFDLPGRQSTDTTVVFGHWSALGFRMRKDLIALDSGCLWGGKLTAVRLEDRAAFQVVCG